MAFVMGRRRCPCGNLVVRGRGNLAVCASCIRRERGMHKRMPGGDNCVQVRSLMVFEEPYRINLSQRVRERLAFNLETA
jgi:hypothetical protein